MKATKGPVVRFEADEKIYPLEAAKAAAYAFTDRVYARIEGGKGGSFHVTLEPKPGLPEESAKHLEGEFRNELLHQALRLRISESNREIREYIVTKALVSAQPAEAVSAAAAAAGSSDAEDCPECRAEAQGRPAAPTGGPRPAVPAPVDAELEKEIDRLLAEIEGGDGGADPLGVAVPWEKKFEGKPAKGAKKVGSGTKGRAQQVQPAAAQARPAEPTPVDAELEKEIDKVLGEIEGGAKGSGKTKKPRGARKTPRRTA